MFCELLFVLVSFTALVALERLLPCVRLHVVLQITRRGARVVALVTLERLFSSMHTHNVVFQMTSCNARKLAHCASLWLFTRVCLLVRFQAA